MEVLRALKQETITYSRAASPMPVPRPITRATATGDSWSPRDQPLPKRRSTGSPRTRRHPISATVSRMSSSSSGSATADAVWKSSVANGRLESGTARGLCDRAAHLRQNGNNILTQPKKYSNILFRRNYILVHCLVKKIIQIWYSYNDIIAFT